jgi:osmoprotectant transport system substrate-binding protein
MSVLPAAKLLPVVTLVALICAACGSAGTSSTSPGSTTRVAATRTATTATISASSSQTTSTTSTAALPGAGRPAITVGDKNYTEQFVLGQLYVQALRAQGFTVNVNENIGPTQVRVQALTAGSLTVYPEYLNTFDSSIAGYRHGFHTQLGAFQAGQHWALRHGMQLLAPTPFSDTSAIAVTDGYAEANHLRAIGDLSRVMSTLTIGGPAQFQQGDPGMTTVFEAYGVAAQAFKALAVGDQYAALSAGSVQAADVYTTDGQLASGDYALLRDPRRIFGWGNVVPVVSAKATAAEGPAFVDTIQRVDDTLTTAVMRELNQAVDIAQQNPAAVAKQFLETHNLLTPQPL